MGVIVGAVGKSPSIDKCNRLLQEGEGQSVGEYMEKQVIMNRQEWEERYPKIDLDFSFAGGGSTEDESV